MWLFLILVFSGVILTAYIVLLTMLLKVWRSQEVISKQANKFNFSVSVIIPVRNEAYDITSCINCILDNNYPSHLVEILVVDDHSTDDTCLLVEKIESDNLTVLSLPEGVYGKKEAITYGVNLAKHDIILVTDADTVVGVHWISSHASQYHNLSTNAVTGSVFSMFEDTRMGRFQLLDYLSVMAATAFGFRYGLFWLANGANMSFKKRIFQKIRGYKGNEHIASGDDVFLFKKIRELDEKSITFIHHPNIMVRTAPEATWSAFLQQRKRWATKSTAFASIWLICFQGFVFLAVFYPYFLMIMSIGISKMFYIIGLMFFMIKLLVDYNFLKNMEISISGSGSLKNFTFSAMLHTVYIFCAFYWAFFPSAYRWKSRRINS